MSYRGICFGGSRNIGSYENSNPSLRSANSSRAASDLMRSEPFCVAFGVGTASEAAIVVVRLRLFGRAAAAPDLEEVSP